MYQPVKGWDGRREGTYSLTASAVWKIDQTRLNLINSRDEIQQFLRFYDYSESNQLHSNLH